MTVVEAIIQVYRRKTNSKILVTAPSNTAADLLASRLIGDIPPEQMLRLNARSRYSAIEYLINIIFVNVIHNVQSG